MPQRNTSALQAAEPLITTPNGFENFGLPPKLMQSLNRMNFTTPTPVQAASIPLAMQGRDILGSAQTGTGKTGAFGIPLVAKLMEQEDSTALIMTPTRELATQVADMIQQLVPVANIKIAVLIGGEAMPRQFRQLQANPRIVVGTPGRLNDHLRRGTLKLSKASFLVLDETDRMLDMGFGPQLDEIMKFMPAQRQTMLFSATLPSNIVQLSKKYLTNPERVAVGSLTSPITKIKQETISVVEAKKYDQLIAELEERKGSIIIFVKTKHGAQRLSDKLSKEDHRSDAIHGDLQQRRRDRVISEFRDKRFRILVATDVAARGLDIPHIAHVINYDLPQVAEDYIHRIGRTARAGAEGSAINFVTAADGAKWRAIQRLLGGQTSDMETGRGKGGKGGSGGRSSRPANQDRNRPGAKPFGAKRSGPNKWDDTSRAPRSAAARPGESDAGAYESKRTFRERPAAEDRNYGPKKTYGERKFGSAARPAGERSSRSGERSDARPRSENTRTYDPTKASHARPEGAARPRTGERSNPKPGGRAAGRPEGQTKTRAKLPQSNRNKGKPTWAS